MNMMITMVVIGMMITMIVVDVALMSRRHGPSKEKERIHLLIGAEVPAY
jgi:hypothetical protein